MSLSDYCQSQLHNMCHSCACDCHKNRIELDPDYAPTAFVFYEAEVKALWRILKDQYINYNDTEAMSVGTKVRKIVDGLAAGPSKST